MDVSELVGKTLESVTNLDGSRMLFTVNADEVYHLYHCQECCESVSIDDINVDLDDLVGVPILVAEERFNPIELPPRHDDDEYAPYTWTFYEFRTIKGSVTVRWYGSSNGNYSENVAFDRVDNYRNWD